MPSMILLNHMIRSIQGTVFIIGAALLLGGCLGIGSPSSSQKDAGSIIKSLDRGAHFEPKGLIAVAGGKALSLDGVDIVTLVMDPFDSQTLYAGTVAHGLYISTDGAESWASTKISQGSVRSLQIDPKQRCTFYSILQRTKVVRTTDCGRTFDVVFTEPRQGTALTSLTLDRYNPSLLYLGTSEGDVLHTRDRGDTWSVLKRFNDRVDAIILGLQDTRIIYIATAGSGIWVSLDRGIFWNAWKSSLEGFPGSMDFRDLVEDPQNAQHLILVSRFGLLQTFDQGGRFEQLPIITRPQQVPITAFTLNPQNALEMYYTDNGTLYHSTDGGSTWSTKKLTFAKVVDVLLVDPRNPNVLYAGLTQ